MPTKIDFLSQICDVKTAPDQPLEAPIRWSQALVFYRNDVAWNFREAVWKPTEILGFCWRNFAT